ncbi:hypothetical protein ACGFI9_37290 [Micromonospora sp. NPDC048930]|uniref:hypothetical protein n=1 Tax=Micromonospora sp. NPDC048930 TaxID=3364261 RepID=UPI00371489EF
MTEEFREVDIPLVRLSQPYVDQLVAQAERLYEQLDAIDEQIDKIYDDAKPALEALEAKVPDKPKETPTAVEWLTRWWRRGSAPGQVAYHVLDGSLGSHLIERR